jgi:ribose 5-phosphate isomerase A
MDIKELKKIAAEKAVEEIKDGMVVGFGTGSTFQFALEKIADKLKRGELKNIVGVCSSERTRLESIRLGIPLATLNELYQKRVVSSESLDMREENLLAIIDVTIDGADEVDDELNLIKGGGGALLGEKIIVQATKKFIVIVDEGKLSRKLGNNFAVPIEVIRKAEDGERAFLEMLGAVVKKRLTANDEEYITDEGNIILDAKFEQINDVDALSRKLNARAGIVEHGIFEKCYVEKVVCAMNDGKILIKENSTRIN